MASVSNIDSATCDLWILTNMMPQKFLGGKVFVNSEEVPIMATLGNGMALLHQAVVPDTPVIFKLGLGGDDGVCMSTQPLHIEIKQQTTVAVVSWPGTVEVLNTRGLATLMVWPAEQADRCTGNTACLGLWCPEASQTPKVLNENKIVLLEDVTSETEMKLVTAKADGGWEWEGAPFSNRKCFKTPTRRELGIIEISNIDSTSKSIQASDSIFSEACIQASDAIVSEALKVEGRSKSKSRVRNTMNRMWRGVRELFRQL